MNSNIMNKLDILMILLIVSVSLTSVFTFSGCKKNGIDENKLPKFSAVTIIAVTHSLAAVNLVLSGDGGSPVTEAGIMLASSKKIKTISPLFNLDYSVYIEKLDPNTTYIVKPYATNATGTFYGKEITFTTKSTPPQTPKIWDQDGNTYDSITIGKQVWLVQNLKVTHYLNGDPIPNVSNRAAWGNLTTGAYCWYNYDPMLGVIYGGLYNWYTIADPRGIGIKGWHVPNYNEFQKLITFLGGVEPAYSKLLEAGIDHWLNSFVTVTNSSGFTALPNGMLDVDPVNANNPKGFWYLGITASYWTSEAFMNGCFAALSMRGYFFNASYTYDPQYGFGIRLIKDAK